MNVKVDFNIGKKNYKLRELTVADHYAIQTELALNEAPGFFITNLLSGCPVEDLKSLSVENWTELWNAVQAFLIDQNKRKASFKPIVILKGVEYGIVDMNKMTIGEFADLDMILNSSDSDRRIHEALAVLYRPVIKKKSDYSFEIADYNEDDYLDRAELFKEFLLSDAKRAVGFFFLSALQSTRATLDSLMQKGEIVMEMETEMPGIIETLLETDKNLNELGTQLSSLYQIQIPSTSTEHQNSEYEQLSTGLHLEKMKSEKQKPIWKRLARKI